jgi:hypothetical protein
MSKGTTIKDVHDALDKLNDRLKEAQKADEEAG